MARDEKVSREELNQLAQDPDFYPPSRTTIEQAGVQKQIEALYKSNKKITNNNKKQSTRFRDRLAFYRDEHLLYLYKGLQNLGPSYQCLDASRPWLCYWILNALDLFDELPEDDFDKIIGFLGRCQNRDGGFGGGPGQLSHFAPSYAAVNALVIIGTEAAYKSIDREGMYRFLLKMKDPITGAFSIHDGGERDVRASYCALSVASMLNLLTPEVTRGCGDFLASCQTYEGGMGGEPGNEAHGGYTFCALSALNILNELHKIDVPRLVEWAVNRQMKVEGGFQGRTNKLVDSCYSFWQGGVFPQLDEILRNLYNKPTLADLRRAADQKKTESSAPKSTPSVEVIEEEDIDEGVWLFDQLALQDYLLICCQDRTGGLKDKPGKSRDYYHTCYALSGLSTAQNNPPDLPPSIFNQNQQLRRLNSVHGVTVDKVEKAREYFSKLPPVHL